MGLPALDGAVVRRGVDPEREAGHHADPDHGEGAAELGGYLAPVRAGRSSADDADARRGVERFRDLPATWSTAGGSGRSSSTSG